MDKKRICAVSTSVTAPNISYSFCLILETLETHTNSAGFFLIFCIPKLQGMLDITEVVPCLLPGRLLLKSNILNKRETQQLKQNIVAEQLINRTEIIS